MVAGAAISTDLSDSEWLYALREIGEREGYYTSLGDDHAAVFIEQSHDVLFVSFETLVTIRSVSDTGMPLAFDMAARKGWSHLTLIATKQDWFRDRRLFSYFDGLVDHGFFENFDRVIFYGAGMCGYAAAAFSVAAPGSTALLVSPQATLDRRLTGWDDRFPSTRRLEFRSRYGYAPDMIEAAEAAYVLFDPEETEDAMHASLFRGPNVHHFRYRRGRAGAIESDLRTLSLISKLSDHASRGTLDFATLAHEMRKRRRHVPYLRALLSRVLAEDRPRLTARLCRAVLAEQPIPRFKHHLEAAERRIAAGNGHNHDPVDDEDETADSPQVS